MTSPVTFGLVGCGRVAPTHMGAIRALGKQGHLTAYCDTDPQVLSSFEGRTKARGYDRLDDLLQKADVDVVAVCTPSGLHADHAIQIAEAGKHVVVEKPMDVSLGAVDRMIAACQDHKVKLYPVFQNRFNPTLQLVKAALDKGRFGRLLAVNSTVIWKRTQRYYDQAAWRGTRAMDGGAFFNQGIHFVDAMRFLGGEVTEVQSMLGRQARDLECEDTGSALFRFENGAMGNIFVTMTGTQTAEGSITLIGETGMVKIGGEAMNHVDLWEFNEPDPDQDDLVEGTQVEIDSVYGSGHKAVYQHIVHDLTGVGSYPITAQDAAQSVRLLHAIQHAELHTLTG